MFMKIKALQTDIWRENISLRNCDCPFLQLNPYYRKYEIGKLKRQNNKSKGRMGNEEIPNDRWDLGISCYARKQNTR